MSRSACRADDRRRRLHAAVVQVNANPRVFRAINGAQASEKSETAVTLHRLCSSLAELGPRLWSQQVAAQSLRPGLLGTPPQTRTQSACRFPPGGRRSVSEGSSPKQSL